MQITDVLAQMGGLKSLAREFGISEEQAAQGADALTPAVLGGIKKQAQTQSTGLEGLAGMLGRLGGGGLLDDVVGSQPTNVHRGNEVLGQIFGSKDVSRAVAQNASSQTGLSADVLKKMLPVVAMMVAGYLAKQRDGGTGAAPSTAGRGGLGGVLGSLFGRRRNAGVGTGTQAGAGWASMLDLDGNGNPLDDILRKLG
jgi:hypothetical protein